MRDYIDITRPRRSAIMTIPMISDHSDQNKKDEFHTRVSIVLRHPVIITIIILTSTRR